MYLTARYGLSILVSLGNMFVLTWWIGPHAYGLFVTAVGLSGFLASLTRLGIDTYLVRCDPTPDRDQYNLAFTLVLVNSVALVVVGVALVPVLKHWYRADEFVPPYLALLLCVPLTGLAGPATAKLERQLNFRAVAGIELGGQLAAFVAAVSLAWCGLGVWAPIAGIFVWQAVALFAACRAARFSPRLIFHATQARKMLAYGLGFSVSMRIWQLRSLVNPVLVGRLVGTEAVAFAALAIRAAEGLGFVRMAAGRLALAALARLQQDRAKFQDALQRALQIQVLTLGPLLCVFALCGPWLVPRFMGERWIPALQVYPFVAAAVLVNSVFNLQASALFVVGQHWAVVRAYASHVALLAGGTFLLLPRTGLTGYGWAELLACAGYIFIHSSVSRVASLSYRRLVPWVVLFLLPLAALMIGLPSLRVRWLAFVGLLLAFQWRHVPRVLSQAWSTLIENAHVRHFLTFLMKTRQRGCGYVRAVLNYQFQSALYWLQHAGRRSLYGARLIEVCNAVQLPDHDGFHFSANQIPQIVASVPSELKEKTMIEADRVLQQHFCFRGREHVFVEHFDWNFCPDGNLSWSWDLNRHAFFLKLAAAYYYSGERKYLLRLVSLWTDWIANNPAGQGTNWQYPFEVAARLQNWMWAYFLLAYSGHPGKRQLQRLVLAIGEHADYVDAHLEYHWPNNHLLLEAKALYEFALLFPQGNKKFLSRARAVLEQEATAQILPDGVHTELCSMYHQIVAGELGELALLGRRQGRPLPDVVEDRILRMDEFSQAALRDDGSMPLLGDSALQDSYLRFDLVRRQSSDLNYWLCPSHAASPFSEAKASGPELRIFPDGGYAFLSVGRDSNPTHLTFDIGSFSRCPTANHAHCDALSFELYADRRPLIIDPGLHYSWTEGSPWRRYFQSTGSHNTLKIDGKEQSEMCGYAGVGHAARIRLLDQWCNYGEASVTAECIPFWVNGEGIEHVREVRLRDHTMLVRDCVNGSGRHLLEWSFQFAPAIEVTAQRRTSLTANVAGRRSPVLEINPLAEILPCLRLFCGATNPLRGWVSRNSAEVLPAPMAVYSLLTDLPFEIEFEFQLPA